MTLVPSMVDGSELTMARQTAVTTVYGLELMTARRMGAKMIRLTVDGSICMIMFIQRRV